MVRSRRSKNKSIKHFCLVCVSQRSGRLIRNSYAALGPCTSSPQWGFLCFTPHSGLGAFFLPRHTHHTSACSSPLTDCAVTNVLITFQTLTTGFYKNGNNLLGASNSATNNSALLPPFPSAGSAQAALPSFSE